MRLSFGRNFLWLILLAAFGNFDVLADQVFFPRLHCANLNERQFLREVFFYHKSAKRYRAEIVYTDKQGALVREFVQDADLYQLQGGRITLASPSVVAEYKDIEGPGGRPARISLRKANYESSNWECKPKS